MKFEDAVKEMKKGKKFINPITKRINFLMLGNILEQIENEYHKAVICLQEIESEDWEVVEEDKDWCLKQYASIYEGIGEGRTYKHGDVKMMLDLISKDIAMPPTFQYINEYHRGYWACLEHFTNSKNKRSGLYED